MTRQDFFIKWGVYALALLPVWFCELYAVSYTHLTLPTNSRV